MVRIDKKVKDFKKNGVIKFSNVLSKKLVKKCLKELLIKKNYQNAMRDGNVVFDSKGKKKSVKYLMITIKNFFWIGDI